MLLCVLCAVLHCVENIELTSASSPLLLPTLFTYLPIYTIAASLYMSTLKHLLTYLTRGAALRGGTGGRTE